MPSLITVGCLGAPFGVEGWQHVTSYTSPIENILSYSCWHVQQKDQWVPVEILANRRHGQGIVVQLKGVNDRESAALLTNNKIAVLRAQLLPLAEDEFYWADLEGLKALTEQGEPLGEIAYLYDNAGTDIVVIKTPEKEQHIPFLMHDTIVKVDLASRQVVINWEF